MKYKITLKGKTYEVLVEQGEAIIEDEYDYVPPVAPVAAAPVAAPAAAPAPAAAAPAGGAVAAGDEWIDRIISTWDDASMQQLCDVITDGAQTRRKDGRDDDITVIAMRLKCA